MFENQNIFFLCQLNLPDPVQKFFTTNTQDFLHNKNNFLSYAGMEIQSINKTLTIAPDELNISFLAQKIDFELQNLKIQLSVMHNNQKKIIFVGQIVETNLQDGQIFCKALSQKLQTFTTIGKIFSKTCRATLGDKNCDPQKQIQAIKDQIVTKIENHSMQFDDSQIAAQIGDKYENGYFDDGYVIFDNHPQQKVFIKTHFQGSQIIFQNKPAFTINNGDKFSIFPGCDKKIGTCKKKFNNIINFQGEDLLTE